MTRPIPRRDFLALMGAGAVGLLFPTFFAAAGEPNRRKPNFIFILGEGQGWTSTSVQMDDALPDSKSDLARTPNLEKLAQKGMRFADAYASLPRCTPARASLFTGKNPALLHMTFVGEGGGNRESGFTDTGSKMIPPHCLLELPSEETTIGDLLKRAGYATAHFGKWHVGRISPSQHGFGENDGATSNRGPGNSEDPEHPNPKEAFGMTERGIAFMTRNVKAGKPFYLQMSHYAGRGAEGALKQTYEDVSRRAGGRDDKMVGEVAVMEDMDTTIGTILKKVDELGIAGNTYIIYTADHGSPGRNTPLRGGKGTLWEGGIRVPLIIRGPGIKAGACSHTRAIGSDLFPTFAELAHVGEPLPKGLDGGSLVPVLMNGGSGAVKRSREELVFHYPHYDHDNDGPASAILLGNYKLIKVHETGGVHLFDLSKDIGEQHDLAKAMPDKAAELERRLTADLKALNAQMPTANPNYDPGKAPETKKGRKRKNKRDDQ